MTIALPPGRVHFRGPRTHLRLVEPMRNPALPLKRSECEGGSRPCPLISCRHNLTADVSRAGGLTIHWDPAEHPDRPSCALDVTDAAGDGHTVEATGVVLGVSRERVRQMEFKAMRKAKRELKKRGLR